MSSTAKKIDRLEEMKRQSVFTKTRKTVLIKVLGIDALPCVLEKPRNDFAADFNHTAEACLRGLDPNAYQRPVSDTGFCLLQKEPTIKISNLLKQLNDLGLRYIGCHFQMVDGKKKPVQTFQFSSEGETLPIPDEVAGLLNSRFSEVSVWCNLRVDQKKGGQFRLDTINLNGPHTNNKPARELTVEGNTYRLNP